MNAKLTIKSIKSGFRFRKVVSAKPVQNVGQGVLGIKVKIMLPWDPNGKIGPKKPLPDNVGIVEPKEETFGKDRTSAEIITATAGAVNLVQQQMEKLGPN